MNKFIRKILLVPHPLKCLYLDCFRGDLYQILQRYDGNIGGLFFIWRIALYSDALSHSCTKLRNCYFVSKFSERIEDSTLWFY